MATFVASSTYNNTFTTTVTPSFPTGVTDGDILIAAVMSNDNTAPITAAPAGWKPIESSPIVAGTSSCGVWYVVYATGMSSPSWTITANLKASAVIVAYRGVHPVVPLQIGVGNNRSTSIFTQVAPSLTTTDINQIVLGVFMSKASNVGPITSDPSGMTIVDGVYTTGGGATAAHIYSMTVSSPAATGDKTATYTTNGASGYGIQIAINNIPAPASIPWLRA